MKLTLLAVAVVAVFAFSFTTIASSVWAFQVPTDYGTVDIITRISGTDYSTGPVTAKIPEGDIFDIITDFTPSTSFGFDVNLLDSSSSFNVVEGNHLNTLKSYRDVKSGEKKTIKWTLKVTGNYPSAQFDLYFKLLGSENSVQATQNIANITILTQNPQRITSATPNRLEPGFSGNFTLIGGDFPRDLSLKFLSGDTEDKTINATLLSRVSKSSIIFSIDVSRNATAGPRTIVLTKPTGTAFTFSSLVEVGGQQAIVSSDLKISHGVVSKQSLIYFFAYSPGSGKPSITINNDPAKMSYTMEPIEGKGGLFAFNATFDKIGVKQGDTLTYTVSASGKIQVKSAIIGGVPVSTKALPSLDAQLMALPNPIENLKVSDAARLLFSSALAGMADIGIATQAGGQVVVVNIPNSVEYEGQVNDFHIIFSGRIEGCTAIFPEWVCKMLEGNEIDLSGPEGRTLPVNAQINLTEVSGENLTISGFWATHNGSRIELKQKFEPKEIQDCDNLYCPPLTNDQFSDQIKSNVQGACDTIKKSLDCLKSGRINSVIEKVGRIHQPTLKDPAKVKRLIEILEEALKKCGNLIIECDSKWNPGCSNEDVNAYVHYYHNIGDNLHLCPGFCTEKDPEGTILHELTHFGDSTDDINDDLNAHNMNLILPSVNSACK